MVLVVGNGQVQAIGGVGHAVPGGGCRGAGRMSKTTPHTEHRAVRRRLLTYGALKVALPLLPSA